MKQTIFNASFEESQKLVNEKYIKNCLDNSPLNIVRKRTWGVAVILLFTIGTYYVSFLLENDGSTYTSQSPVLVSKLGYMWHILVVVIFLSYLFNLMKLRNKRLLSPHFFTMAMTLAMTLFTSIMQMLLISFANEKYGSNLPTIVYGTITLTFMVVQTISYVQRIENSLYKEVRYSNSFLLFFEKIKKFNGTFGSIAILLLFMFNRWSRNKIQDGGEDSVINQITIFALPGLILIIFLGIFHLAEELMQGYYLNKYYEEYRLMYNYPKKVWYGTKSKEYKIAVENGEEE